MKNRRGMFLISSYLALTVIGTFSLTLFMKNAVTYHAAQRVENRIRAFDLAEAGVDQAIVQLRSNLSYVGQGYTPLGNDGGFQVIVETPNSLQPTVKRITATGHSPSNLSTSYAYSNRQVVAHENFTQSGGGFGLFSSTSVQMSGNAGTDSFDSRNGPYNPSQPRSNGHVGTNTIQAGYVMLSGNVHIGGNVVVGPGGNPSRVIVTSGNVRIDGSRTAAPSLRVLDPVVIPSSLTNLGGLTVNGNNTVTLGAGTYWYSSINVTGNGRVNFTGPATVYVSGNVTLSGNGVGTSQNLPPNLSIKVQGAQPVSYTHLTLPTKRIV